MNKTAIALAVAASIAGIGNVSAASMEDRMMAMEKRLKYLEQRLATQDKVIAEKEAQIDELTANSSGGGWFQNTEIGGVVEVDYVNSDSDGDDSDDLVTATVEVGITTQVNDWVSAELVLLYEEDTDNQSDGDSSFDVDTAMVSIADPDASWFINAGQYTLPFGSYSSHMISDPFTLLHGETGDTAAEAGYSANGFTVSAYVFDGDRFDAGGDSADVNNWGAALGYEAETDSFSFVGHFGYINDVLESDELSGAGGLQSGRAPGWIASAEVGAGDFTIIGEYLQQTDIALAGSTDEPSTYNFEVGYGFDAAGLPATVALGFTGSDEADGLVAEESIRGVFGLEIMDGTSVAFEYANDEDYDGTDTDTFTGRLGIEF